MGPVMSSTVLIDRFFAPTCRPARFFASSSKSIEFSWPCSMGAALVKHFTTECNFVEDSKRCIALRSSKLVRTKEMGYWIVLSLENR